jgi:hypothetical protein
MLPDRLSKVSTAVCSADGDTAMDRALSLKVTSTMVGALHLAAWPRLWEHCCAGATGQPRNHCWKSWHPPSPPSGRPVPPSSTACCTREPEALSGFPPRFQAGKPYDVIAFATSTRVSTAYSLMCFCDCAFSS